MADSPRNYLSEYDRAASEDKYPLVQTWMQDEPLPFFKQLREQRPVLVTPECALVTLFADVRDLLQMPRVFTVDLYKPKMGVTDTDEGYLMAHDDDALHYREKSLMQGILNRDDLPHVRRLIAKNCAKILDQADGSIEVVHEYCRTVPAILVQEYFGLDGIGRKDLIKWSFWNQYDAFHNQPFHLNSKEKFQHIVDKHNEVSEELAVYIALLVGRKLLKAKLEMLKAPLEAIRNFIMHIVNFLLGQQTERHVDDIVTRMLKTGFDEQVDFPLTRLGVNAGGLLIGAIETTSQAVSQSIEFFLERPELLARAKAAAQLENPDQFDAMVWEALRFVPISPYSFRKASSDYTIAKGTEHETLIKAGTNVLLVTQSAMFDPYAFKEPDTFNPDRNWYHHFNFGFGSHECLGKYVGVVMIPEMIRQVFLRQNIESTGSINYKDGPFPEEYHLRWA